MKVIIVSDIHANLESLACLPADYDYLLCAGDLVDYGPDPKAVLAFMQIRAQATVRGNHDQAVGYRVDCGCGYVMKELSIATRELAWQALDNDDINYLKELPLEQEIELEGYNFYLTHAVPGDLHRYLEADVSDDELSEILAGIRAQVIIWGHTHKPWIKVLKNQLIINPGSLGQPRDGNPNASYVIWEDGKAHIIRRDYDRKATIEKLNQTLLKTLHKKQLANVLKTGGSLD